MKIFKDKNVFDEALDRIRLIYDEFPEVIVSFSGGKDSTIILELAKIVAREKGRLPVPVFWLDQECEFASTAEYVKTVMYDPEVKPLWYQIPFRLQNATSANELWLNCWGEGEEWVREKDPISIQENTFGIDRFVALMEGIVSQTYPDTSVAALTGVRAEESPTRFMAVTEDATFRKSGSSLISGKKISKNSGEENSFNSNAKSLVQVAYSEVLLSTIRNSLAFF